MSTDLTTTFQPDLAAQVEYARFISEGDLLPVAYRKKPANVLIAIGLARALRIEPTQALYEVYVVNGRPSVSANLMAALVRRAGHRLRVDGDATTCTATLIRSDDPEAPFTATWTLEQARLAGLAGKDTWKQYPAAMLRARAIADVVRQGASEAVLGMQYAREELQDVTVVDVADSPRISAADFLTPAPHVEDDPHVEAPVVEEQVETGEAISDRQRRALFAAFAAAGFTSDARSDEGRAQRLEYLSRVTGRAVDSTNDLTRTEAAACLVALTEDAGPDTAARDMTGEPA